LIGRDTEIAPDDRFDKWIELLNRGFENEVKQTKYHGSEEGNN
jgi:hypothetical protein